MSSPKRRIDETSAGAGRAREFATTQWSLVVCAGDAGRADSMAALETLCRKYWHPLFRFARCHGMSLQDAEDLTQGFFADLLERGIIARADPSRGRFRTFLLRSFVHFHGHQRERAVARKRGGDRRIVPLDALQRFEIGPMDEGPVTEPLEKHFDRAWALQVLDHAMETLRRDYAAAGRETTFHELKAAIWGGSRDVKYAELGERLQLTEGAIRVAVHRLRRRFRDALRYEVAMTVNHPDEVDDELRYLLGAVAQ